MPLSLHIAEGNARRVTGRKAPARIIINGKSASCGPGSSPMFPIQPEHSVPAFNRDLDNHVRYPYKAQSNVEAF